ncbi:hypothetical protein K435DRAFT_104408 [Dendrothele bispora CBS 962.96]|uniref:Nucleoporin Nup54 alpha-helical domain-containing protein n=1 Tax=Dendrothele bispora (strain CBS 962.96) TaxID=1314807 RepID=A0A4S8MQR5_DENBC|nr:hypothetical protein K435DRAFT_104408 [Dendrothele bispora CBS 962.96]
MSIFGSSTNAPAAGGSSIFGASNTQPGGTSSGSGLFGSFGQNNASTNQQPQQPAQSIFGNTGGATNAQQQQPGTSLFGNANANTQQPTTSLFGNTNNTATAGTTGGTGLFGNNTGGSLFGKPATPAPAPGGSLFGNTNNATTTNTTAPSTGLFGGTSAQPAAGSSSFFATPPAGQQQPQQQQNANAPKPGLFGNSTNPLFGGSSNNTTGATPGSTGLFGASTTANPLFSNSTTGTTGTIGTGPLFGNSTAQTVNANAAGNTLFGSTLGASTLGAKPATGFGGATGLGTSTLSGQAQGADAQVQFTRLQEKINVIVGAWDAINPTTCRFQHYFYNLVDPAQVNLYGRPPNAINETLWQKAVRENPDPSCSLVPVLAVGFDSLRERVDAQSTQSTAHKEKLVDLQKRLEALKGHHTTTTVPRLQRYSALQTQLMHRLLKLVQHLHLLIPSVRSSAIGEHEEALRGALEEAVSEIGLSGSARSNGEARDGRGGKLKSKLGELWAVIGALKAREESLLATVGSAGEWKVVDEDGLARIAQVNSYLGSTSSTN